MVSFNGKKIADIGYFINLDERTDRLEKLESQLSKFKIEGVERVSANKSTSSGPTNCKRSHYDLLKKLVDSEYETLLVLEDDCLFLDFLLEESDEIFDNINKTEWDLFWLGCRNRRTPLLKENNCYRVSSVAHTQSYLIKKDFAKHLLDAYPIYPYDGHNNVAIDELLTLSIYGYDVVHNPNSINFYNLDQPLDVLETHYTALCYERALTTQYSSYSDLWGYETQWEDYIIKSFPKW